MSLVRFKHRSDLPPEPEKGSFYWIGTEEDTQLWFAYGNTQDQMILLNEKVDLSSINTSISNIENRLGGIKDEVLDEIDLSPYITDEILNGRLETLKNEILEKIDELSGSDFGDFVTRDDVIEMMRDWSPDVELDDSDYEAIAEKVKLTWQII